MFTFYSIYVPTLVSQFHAMYSHIFAFIGKAISCYTFMGKAKKISTHSYLKSHFMPYAPILRNIFVPFSAHMHIGKALGYLPNTCTLYLPLAAYSMTNISTSSRHKEPLKHSLHQMLAKGGTLPICSHFYAILCSKMKTWVPMPRSHI